MPDLIYICFRKPWCTDEACCCGGDDECVDGEDWGTIAEYGTWRSLERFDLDDAGYGGAAHTYMDPTTFNYLTSQAASRAAYWSGGVANTTRWSTAWLMPGYAKFFESETSENYKMRVMTFKGWSATADVYPSGWGKGTVKPSRTGIHLGYQGSTSVGRNWNNITWNGSSTNDSRRATAFSLETTSGGDEDVEGNRTDIFNTAKKADDELDAVTGYGKYMLISRTTFFDQDQAADGDSMGRWMNMPWPLCRIPSSVDQAQRMGMYDSHLGTRIGIGAANPVPAMDADGNPMSARLGDSAKAYAVVYNPKELKGLIERFGPYEYLAGTGEFIPVPTSAHFDIDRAALEAIIAAADSSDEDIAFAEALLAIPSVNWHGGEFVVDRRTISRIKHWYNLHTWHVGFGITIAGDPSAAIFRKTKSPAYKKSDLYTLGREVERTPSGAPTTYRGRAGGVRGPEDSVAIGDGVMTMVIPPTEDY